MRTVMADTRDVQRQYGALVKQDEALRSKRAPGREGRRARKTAEANAQAGKQLPADTPAALSGRDNYLTKIAKYVPAETIAVTTLGFGIFDPAGNWVWFWLAIGACANVIYLFSTAIALPTAAPRPRVYFYVLSVGAFFAWAIAVVSDAQKAAHISGDDAAQRAGFVLACAAFLIPALDEIFYNLDLKAKKS